MRIITVLVLLFTLGQKPRGAREYYNELYAGGVLDRFAANYACFDEDPTFETFFIYNKSSNIREGLAAGGKFLKMPKDMRVRLNKDWVVVRNYDKGVPSDDENFYDRDGSTWVSDKFKVSNECCLRVRLTVTSTTMRYKRSLEVLNSNGTMKKEVSRYGKCEPVKPNVAQIGE